MREISWFAVCPECGAALCSETCWSCDGATAASWISVCEECAAEVNYSCVQIRPAIRPCQVAAHRVSTGFSNFRFEGPMPSFQFRENQL
jgi:hypothetical protein